MALDGRSSSGKSTLAGRLQQAVPGSHVVHTDDIAWRHSVFDWVDQLTDGVLRPLHEGHLVALRPPAWDIHDRPGAIEVPENASLVVIEGVGAGRREVAHLIDTIVWVHTEPTEINRRNTARTAAGETSPANFTAWMAEETPFVAEQRTWERAAIIVAGSGSQVLIADPTSTA